MPLPSIQYESSLLSQNELDIDKLRKRYLKKDSDIGVYFVSPYLLAYEKYRQYLLKNSVLEPLSPIYYYRPDYLSFDLYGSTMFWTVILYINNISCIEDFNVEEIYLPSFSAINLLSELKENENAVIDLDEIDSRKIIWPKMYVPTERPKQESQPIPVETVSLNTYKREQFTISISDITNEYVVLSQEPLIESIVVRLKDQIVVPLYGVHYIAKLDEDLNSWVISWSDADTQSGSGLNDIILLNSILEVQYQIASV